MSDTSRRRMGELVVLDPSNASNNKLEPANPSPAPIAQLFCPLAVVVCARLPIGQARRRLAPEMALGFERDNCSHWPCEPIGADVGQPIACL